MTYGPTHHNTLMSISIVSYSLQDFTDCTSEQLQNIVQTNLVGSLLCARGAWRVMRSQATGGHIFNIDGAGADGNPTPQYAAYGATKAGEIMRLVFTETAMSF